MCCVVVFHTEVSLLVVEVLDALMNHLEETLEVVLSRGENLALDNKVGNRPPTPKLVLALTWVHYTPHVPPSNFVLPPSLTLVLLSLLWFFFSSRSCCRLCC